MLTSSMYCTAVTRTPKLGVGGTPAGGTDPCSLDLNEQTLLSIPYKPPATAWCLPSRVEALASSQARGGPLTSFE